MSESQNSIQSIRDKMNEYGELPGCFVDDADDILKGAQSAIEILEKGCDFYWQVTESSTMQGDSMAYVLVSTMRLALKELDTDRASISDKEESDE